MLATFFSWLAKLLLEMALNRAISEAESALRQAQLDHDRGVTDAANAEAYRNAQIRADKIKAATALLNGTRLP